MKKKETDTEKNLDLELFEKLKNISGLTGFEKISGGHMNTILFKAMTPEGKKRVVKMGQDDSSFQEVDNNIYGYSQLRKIRADGIIPNHLQILYLEENPVIVMDYLESNIHDTVKLSRVNIYRNLFPNLIKLFNQTTTVFPGMQELSIQQTLLRIQEFQKVLLTRKILKPDVCKSLYQNNYLSITSEISTVFLLDFTPSNLFLTKKNKLKFIDPWIQNTYLGSPLISLGQYFTLSHDVHNYKISSNWKEEVGEFLNKIAKIVMLPPEMARAHYLIGSILQLTLSAYVRIDTEPHKAKELGKEIENRILEINAIIKKCT